MIGVDMKDNHIIEDIKKAEQGKSKLQIVIGWFVLLLFVAATVMVFVFSTEIFGENSIFNQNISDNHFVNSVYQLIPVILKTFQIVIICLVLSKIICFILRKSFKRSNRAITIGKLLISCIKWITTIVAVLVILNAWGVDTATLVASAGVLTLIVGLGAQSLVADIVAGIFIVFEGSFQVATSLSLTAGVVPFKKSASAQQRLSTVAVTSKLSTTAKLKLSLTKHVNYLWQPAPLVSNTVNHSKD